MTRRVAVISIYKDKDQMWQWEIKNKINNVTIGMSHRGFEKLTDARSNFQQVTGMYSPAMPPDKTYASQVVLLSFRPHKHV